MRTRFPTFLVVLRCEFEGWNMGVTRVKMGRNDTNDEYTQVGICGEHGGEPKPCSVAFFDGAALDSLALLLGSFVCAVPIARLTAAQVAVQAS
ncbi:AChain A, pyruvate, phosphate dikinase, chloroplastic [Tanacetum coccineum]